MIGDVINEDGFDSEGREAFHNPLSEGGWVCGQ